ncbi:2-amino-4-hydroxy-6-hydroxymethyldihydropteridine diphosphokinase [Oleiagrimonas sp. C23AA]|uniref:2-amino-4-hydroxy-6- hydroxymethyldihydropteridine diphosphokinase n=1 Tax=Oleiagrimonas sp. C23AA TaxID=2719047 RepID=UPI0014214A2B|nr:2-amino-4-hydroxy-6-hydroxymethyldihydropteridine diphosphokinase [Oleiagrimonas sp. C23AA]NII11823.1 2-amino-4-hydroxy-6-hydroxymethyldihydropteridine diphosphokinase [Oleiagrimonas sp. C23AA]
MTATYIGLGSNLGDSVAQVRAALAALDALPQTALVRHSRLYLTPPWGVTEQPAFINAVAELDTRLDAPALLQALLEIERRAGRVRDGERWGPRILDLDLLLHGDGPYRAEHLEVPHPRMAERAFVLLPLVEIAPGLELPGIGRISEALDRLDAGDCKVLED